jgi:hypothetical protein
MTKHGDEAVEVEWPEPWVAVANERRDALEAELQRELVPGHVLFGNSVTAIAKREDRDDVLFGLSDGRVAEVHLTWRGGPETNASWPTTTIYQSIEQWGTESMEPLHQGHVEGEGGS